MFYGTLRLPANLTWTADVRRALALAMADVEDAFQVAAALALKADFIITRILPDYRRSPIIPLSPTAFLNKINS